MLFKPYESYYFVGHKWMNIVNSVRPNLKYIYPNIYTHKYTYRLKLLSGEVEQEEDWEIYKLKGIHILVQTIEI